MLNNNGLAYQTLEGTDSANGYSILKLGNATASGTSGNKYGRILAYGTGAYYTNLDFGTQTANRTITFPDATGTVASTSSTVSKANQLTTARNINGTSFNGTANITTANWGTARNISIADSDATNTGTAVSVNGSANVTLKLPATIKATIKGNADTATKATQDSDGKAINSTYLKLAGGEMAGNIIQKNLTLHDGVQSRTVIEMFDDGDTTGNYGSELVISPAGNTFIGSGESAKS